MKVQFEDRGRFLIGTLGSRVLDVSNCRPFKDLVAAAVGEKRRDLILDMRSVEEIDSAGLGALVAILKWVRRYDGSMRICGLRETVREVFELTMLHRIFPLNASVEDALKEDSTPRIAYAD